MTERERNASDGAALSGYRAEQAEVTVLDADERRFIERLAARDERAFNELVRLYHARIFNFVLKMVGRKQEAEDLTQEVFVQVFKAVGGFRGDAKLGTWLYRIALNLSNNRRKYLARRHSSAQDELEPVAERSTLAEGEGVTFSTVPRPDQAVEGRQLELLVRSCLEHVEEDFRVVLVLRDVEDLDYDEIAAITGLPEGTVKSRLHRGRAMLKKLVETALGAKR